MANKEIIDRDTYKKIKKMNREELMNIALQLNTHGRRS